MFDRGKVSDIQLVASIQPSPGRGGGPDPGKTGEVQSQNNWIKTGS
jgi:hypothetical protein